MKRFLLAHLEEPNNRRSVIYNMQSTNDPVLEEYVIASKTLILDFFKTFGELTPELEEQIELVFKINRTVNSDLSKVKVLRGEHAGKEGLVFGEHDKKII